MNEPRIEEIVSNIRQKLGSWDQLLWTFTSSNQMRDIVRKLIEIKEDGGYFVPSLSDALHVYSIVKPAKVRCIILTSLKSNSVELADGNKIAMQPNTETIRAVLRTICDPVPDVYKWSSVNGILQICTTPTSTLNGLPHQDIWKQWNAYIINRLNELYLGIPWIIIGKDANQYITMIRSEYKFIVSTWPVNANDSWNKVNEVLVTQGKKPVDWTYRNKNKGTIDKREARIRRIERWLKKKARNAKK